MSILLETPRLLIQTIQSDQDFFFLLDIHNHPNTMRWIPNNKLHWTIEDLIEKYQINQTLNPQQLGLYKIVLKQPENHILIGEVVLFPCADSSLSIEIGYIIQENFWKQGLATELLEAVIVFIQQHLPYEIICAQLFEGNIASRKLVERCNFQHEDTVILPLSLTKLIYYYYIVR